MPGDPDLRIRTKQLALRVIKLSVALPQSEVGRVIGKQLLRSGTSVGANYREGTRARSPAEFVSKLQIGLQELEETAYWLELLVEGEILSAAQLTALVAEVNEIIAMLVASINTAKQRAGLQ
jgi:four helix bundle protein